MGQASDRGGNGRSTEAARGGGVGGGRYRIAPLFPASSRGIQDLLTGFMEVGHAHGLSLITNYLHPYVNRLSPRTWHCADGVLIFMGDPAMQHRYVEEAGLPTVNFSAASAAVSAPSVWPDNREIGRVAAEHLLDVGLRDCAWFGSTTTHFGAERRAGFVAAIEAGRGRLANLGDGSADALPDHWEALCATFVPLLRALPRPCGIVAVDDANALVLLHLIQEAGLAVPDDIALVGVNDSEQLVVFAEPAVSSVRWNYHGIGERAAELMLAQLAGEQVRPAVVVVGGAEVIARESTRSIAVDDGELAAALRVIRCEAPRRSLTADEVCSGLPVSRKTLDRRMREHLGRSIAEEIRRVRGAELRDRLRDTDWPLKRLAHEMGFASADELSRWCRHHLGAKPGALRDR